MTPKATSPALQKNAAKANRTKSWRTTPAAARRVSPDGGGFRRPERAAPRVWSAPGSGTRRRSQNSRTMAAAAGMDSTAKAADRFPVAASTAATRIGPEQGPDQVEGLVDGEAAAPADRFGDRGQQHGLCRAADGFSDPVTDDQHGSQNQPGVPARASTASRGTQTAVST